MDYRIKRLSSNRESNQYHLYDRDNKLILVADHGSPWLEGLPRSHVRFAKPDGIGIASMDLKAPERTKFGRQHMAYALVANHAVFAIINKYWKDKQPPYFVVEVADILWLVLSNKEEPKNFALYNEVPADLMVFDEVSQSSLPDSVGNIYHGIGEYDYQISMPPVHPDNSALVTLALIFLIDTE